MTQKTSHDFDALYAVLGYTFTHTQHLKGALTHASSARSKKQSHYERLEFLGDRVLALVMAETLFKAYPNEAEGPLAKRHAVLVSRHTLLSVAQALGLEAHLHMSASFAQNHPDRKKSMLSDACEAMIAAIYLDGGITAATDFIARHWQPFLQAMPDVPHDPKSALQEWAQARKLPLPDYVVTEKKGPDHAPSFTICVQMGKHQACATASSKRDAEQEAATQLMLMLAKKPTRKD